MASIWFEVILPMVLLCGIFLTVYSMAAAYQGLSKIEAEFDCSQICGAVYGEGLSYIEAKGVCGGMTYDEYKCCGQAPEGNWSICKVRGDE